MVVGGRGKDVSKQTFIHIATLYILIFDVNSTINMLHDSNNQYHSQTLCREAGNRWRDVCIPKQLERTRHQMLCFIFYMFTQSFGGMVA